MENVIFFLNSEIRRSIRSCSLNPPLEVNPIWEATQLAAWMWPNSMPMSLSMLLAPSPCLPMVAHKKVASQSVEDWVLRPLLHFGATQIYNVVFRVKMSAGNICVTDGIIFPLRLLIINCEYI